VIAALPSGCVFAGAEADEATAGFVEKPIEWLLFHGGRKSA